MSIEPGMPAEKAGLKAKDIIAAVDGHAFTYVASFVAYLQQTAGRPVDLTVLRGGQTLQITVKPVLADNGKGHDSYQIGFASSSPAIYGRAACAARGGAPVRDLQPA